MSHDNAGARAILADIDGGKRVVPPAISQETRASNKPRYGVALSTLWWPMMDIDVEDDEPSPPSVV